MTERCQPSTIEAHMWSRIRALEFDNNQAAARIDKLEKALVRIICMGGNDSIIRETARAALGSSGVARTPPDPDPPAHAKPIKSHTRRFGP